MPAESILKTRVLTGMGLIAVLLAATALDCMQLLRTYMLTEERVALDHYIDGEVHRPFAYRVLLPGVMRGIDAVTPAWATSYMDGAGERLAALGMVEWKVRSGLGNKYPRAIAWLAAVQFASLVGYALVGASLYSSLARDRPWNRWIVAVVLLLFLAPIVYKKIGHIYDFTVLFFMACLLWSMANRRHLLYLIIFAVSCLNKETTILMSVAYAAVFFRRLPTTRYAMMLAAQVAIFLAIHVPVRIAFQENPGSGMEAHLHEQIPYFRSLLSNAYILAAVIVTTALFLLLLFQQWSQTPIFLRQAAVMILPQVALVLYGAAPGELRNLYEIMPLISLFMLCSAEPICNIAWRKDTRRCAC